MGRQGKRWTYNERKYLQALAKEGLTKQQIVNSTDWGEPSVARELRRGLTTAEFNSKKYLRYNIEKATVKEFEELFEKEDIRIVVKEYIRNNPTDLNNILKEIKKEEKEESKTILKGDYYELWKNIWSCFN